MAQKSLSTMFVCSSCRYQLAKKPLRATRSFSITPQRSRSIPSFTPTASPELDEIFLSFREKVFTPYALAQHHRDLMYKKSRHHLLQNDPGVTVTLSNDEDIRLMPLEPREKPNKKKSLNQLARLLTETKDTEGWRNLPAFLEGMKMAKETLPANWMEKITRKANLTGKTGIIKLCAEMVHKTGVSLADPQMTRELMLGYHLQAAAGGFTGEPLEKALKSVEHVMLMMASDSHCAGKLREGQRDMRKDPVVLGVLLELTASKALEAEDGDEVHSNLASLVAGTLAPGNAEFWNTSEGVSEVEVAHQLTWWIPISNGMKTALKVKSVALGPNAQGLRTRSANLEETIATVEKRLQLWSEGREKMRPLRMLEEMRANQPV